MSGPARRVRQPGKDTQGALPLRRGCGRRFRALATKCPGSSRTLAPGGVLSTRGREDTAMALAPGEDASDPAIAAPTRFVARALPWTHPHASLLPVTGAWRPGDPLGQRQFLRMAADRPFVLEGGGQLRDITIAFETWGELSPSRDNAVLVCHALTGDAHAAGRPVPATPRPAGGMTLIGPGRPLDTDRYFVVCANVLGGCQGSTGPASPRPGRRRLLRAELPGRVDPRHGPHAGPARRRTRHRALAHRRSAARWAGCRCSSGA